MGPKALGAGARTSDFPETDDVAHAIRKALELLRQSEHDEPNAVLPPYATMNSVEGERRRPVRTHEDDDAVGEPRRTTQRLAFEGAVPGFESNALVASNELDGP